MDLLVIGVASFVSGIACSYVFGAPTRENETIKRTKERLEREERWAAEEREYERWKKAWKGTLKRRREMGIANLERKLEDERQKLQKEEEEEEEERIREKIEEEHYEAIATRKREEEEADRAAEREFGPRRWPTREEFQRAMRSAQYDRSHFHFAIVGKAGCGKSSLINAFRNLRNKDHGAAQAGTRETTLRIGRYPDPGTNPPREWIVWFDVPGAGTQLISDQDYFLKQGLYVFDLIILAIGDRFEKVDGQILEDCARFKVPTFIVRSKADMHILNSMKEFDDCGRIKDNPELFWRCRDTFVSDSQETVSDGLVKQNLPDQGVYIVSRDVLRCTYNSALKRRELRDSSKPDMLEIHERQLVNDLLAAAAERRCGTRVENMTQGVQSLVRDGWRGLSGRNSARDMAHTEPDLADLSGVRLTFEIHADEAADAAVEAAVEVKAEAEANMCVRPQPPMV